MSVHLDEEQKVRFQKESVELETMWPAFLCTTISEGERNPIYGTWADMRNRCSNPKRQNYKYYGARGIAVYKPWAASFEIFWEAVRGTWFPGAWLDRIDNDGNYEPGNVRWATPKEQANNRRPKRKTLNSLRIAPYKGSGKYRFVVDRRIKGERHRAFFRTQQDMEAWLAGPRRRQFPKREAA